MSSFLLALLPTVLTPKHLRHARQAYLLMPSLSLHPPTTNTDLSISQQTQPPASRTRAASSAKPSNPPPNKLPSRRKRVKTAPLSCNPPPPTPPPRAVPRRSSPSPSRARVQVRCWINKRPPQLPTPTIEPPCKVTLRMALAKVTSPIKALRQHPHCEVRQAEATHHPAIQLVHLAMLLPTLSSNNLPHHLPNRNAAAVPVKSMPSKRGSADCSKSTLTTTTGRVETTCGYASSASTRTSSACHRLH